MQRFKDLVAKALLFRTKASSLGGFLGGPCSLEVWKKIDVSGLGQLTISEFEQIFKDEEPCPPCRDSCE